MDPQQPVDDFRSLESFRDDLLLPSRVTASVVGLFSVLALVITATGIAGVVGYAVQQRRREFGVRLALGAPRTRVLAMVLGQGLSLVALGLFAGACASLPLLPLICTLPADSGPSTRSLSGWLRLFCSGRRRRLSGAGHARGARRRAGSDEV